MTKPAICLLLLLCPLTAHARALGGRGMARAAPPRVAATAPTHEKLELGFYATPLFGYESNHNLAPPSVPPGAPPDAAKPEGSAIWSLEGGAELKYRPSTALLLRTELSAMVRMPISSAGLTEFLVELPLLAFYRLTPQLELFLSNHVGVERSRTSAVFFDKDVKNLTVNSGDTLTYFAFYETLRPALAYHLVPGAFVEVGPYFRVKQMNLSVNIDEPDYRLFDLGADLSGKYVYKRRFSARLRYDFAYRLFQNHDARPPEYEDITKTPSVNPLAGTRLGMYRHQIGAYLGAHVWGPISVNGSYSFRLVRDNGGYNSYNEHLVGGDLDLSFPGLFALGAGIFFQKRGYTNRTPCEGGACGAPGVAQQAQSESSLVLNGKVTVPITEWLQALAIYEMEDAAADNLDPMAPLHRVVAGVSLFM